MRRTTFVVEAGSRLASALDAIRFDPPKGGQAFVARDIFRSLTDNPACRSVAIGEIEVRERDYLPGGAIVWTDAAGRSLRYDKVVFVT